MSMLRCAVPALLAATVAAASTPSSRPAPRELFDGLTLSGWEGDPAAWHVEDGAITGTIADGTLSVVRTMTGPVNVPKAEVVSHEVTAQSLMPAGLLDALPEREVVELLLFLTTAQE